MSGKFEVCQKGDDPTHGIDRVDEYKGPSRISQKKVIKIEILMLTFFVERDYLFQVTTFDNAFMNLGRYGGIRICVHEPRRLLSKLKFMKKKFW